MTARLLNIDSFLWNKIILLLLGPIEEAGSASLDSYQSKWGAFLWAHFTWKPEIFPHFFWSPSSFFHKSHSISTVPETLFLHRLTKFKKFHFCLQIAEHLYSKVLQKCTLKTKSLFFSSTHPFTAVILGLYTTKSQRFRYKRFGFQRNLKQGQNLRASESLPWLWVDC